MGRGGRWGVPGASLWSVLGVGPEDHWGVPGVSGVSLEVGEDSRQVPGGPWAFLGRPGGSLGDNIPGPGGGEGAQAGLCWAYSTFKPFLGFHFPRELRRGTRMPKPGSAVAATTAAGTGGRACPVCRPRDAGTATAGPLPASPPAPRPLCVPPGTRGQPPAGPLPASLRSLPSCPMAGAVPSQATGPVPAHSSLVPKPPPPAAITLGEHPLGSACAPGAALHPGDMVAGCHPASLHPCTVTVLGGIRCLPSGHGSRVSPGRPSHLGP